MPVMLNQKLSCKFEKWHKFTSCVKAQMRKRKSYKRDLPVLPFGSHHSSYQEKNA
jgi:hypothetical protein